MYELVMKIYDTSRDEGCDIGVAYEKVAQKDGRTDALNKAFKFSQMFYDYIVHFRKTADFGKIQTIIDIFNKDGEYAVRQYVKDLKDNGKY